MTAETDVRSTENLPQQILDFLQESNEFNSIQLAQQWNLDHQKVIGAIKSLLANEGVLTTKDVTEKRLELTNEGVQFANEGSPEYLVFEFVGTDGAAQADIQVKKTSSSEVSNSIFSEETIWKNWYGESYAVQMGFCG